MKDLEWLKEEVRNCEYITEHDIRRLSDLIDQLDEPNLPVIPGYVAEYIKETKDDDLFELLGELSDSTTSQNMKKEHRLYFWIKNNEQMFFKAMALGYTVEEKKYFVISKEKRMMLVRMMDDKTITEADPFTFDSLHRSEWYAYALTEQEIKDFDPRYWEFADPVDVDV